MLRGLLDVQDSAARGHPLRVTIGDRPAAAVGVGVLERAVDDVGDSLEASVRMPGGSHGLAWCPFDLAYLVHVDEWVQVGERYPGECPSHGESVSLEPDRCSGDRSHRPLHAGGGIGDGDPGQSERIRSDGWHGFVSCRLAKGSGYRTPAGWSCCFLSVASQAVDDEFGCLGGHAVDGVRAMGATIEAGRSADRIPWGAEVDGPVVEGRADLDGRS